MSRTDSPKRPVINGFPVVPFKTAKGGAATADVAEVGRSGPWPFDATGNLDKPCKPYQGKKFRAGKIDFVIVPTQAKTRRGGEAIPAAAIGPGPALRLCIRENEPGRLVPVSGPEEAMHVGRKFQDCVESKKSPKVCAAAASERGMALGGVRRRRSR